MSESRAGFFRQSAWLSLATVVGGALMTLVHPVVFKMEGSQYEIFGTMLRVVQLLGIPTAGLLTGFAQQGAASITPELRSQLATTTRRVLGGAFLIWMILALATFLGRDVLSAQLKLGDGRVLWPMLGVGLMILLKPVLLGLLQGAQDFSTLGWVAVLDGVLRLSMTVVTVLVLHLGAAAALTAAFLAMGISSGVAFWRTRGQWTGLGAPVDWGAWVARVLPFTLGATAMVLLATVDVVYLKALIPADQSDRFNLGAAYLPASLVGFALMQVTVPLAMVMFPKIARATAAGTRSDALALALMGTLILGSLAAGFVTLFPRFPLMIVYFNKPEALAAAPVVPWYAWAMVAYTMANVLVSNLLARGRFWIVAWALGITGAYLGTLALIRPHLMGLEPSAVFRTVPQLIGGYSLLLLTIAAWLTWGPGSKPRTACP